MGDLLTFNTVNAHLCPC